MIPSVADLYKIIEQSDLVYVLEHLDSVQVDSIDKARRLNSNMLYLYVDSSSRSLVRHEIDDSLGVIFAIAEGAYEAGDFEAALAAYSEALLLRPSFDPAMVYAGDAYFGMNELDSARAWYQRAVDANFINYQAHWFLGHMMWLQGDSARAIEELTIAHLLNVNHMEIKKVLKSYREDAGGTWRGPDISLHYALTRDTSGVRVRFEAESVAYALVRAVWKYEPGYAESRQGEDWRGSLMQEIAEAAVTWLDFMAGLDDTLAPAWWPQVEELAQEADDSGQVEHFIWYAFIAPELPAAMMLMPREQFDAIREFVDKFY
ncbi:MAG TPA: tetratricopeptide repeat protein [candidate division Zixibacteria bacterium]|nr:tetratricopeptide repeat protein [candidate division Zixibacteria bacterium]MDD4918682.1 tetratricopeptide repeat protein [candidate division Zixibacteria bacterium]MDM7973091.1 tetratricopeptide repeat protein [candidate division Zixibacteria bacterium]HOD66979.1 tetratricopeptide repeat protein [candidate division Zixibacteria bacterium]HOZ07535.1 tetratricopeptide repeat protein [candidate division Zixibacteria bacterium]